MKRNFYKILGVNQNADPGAIKKAYRKRAKRYHPDISPRDEDKFKEIQEAYETLSDPERKATYDREGLEPPPPPAQYFHSAGTVDFPFHLFHIMEGLFPGFGDFIPGEVAGFWSEKGDIPDPPAVEIILTPEEARSGGEIFLKIPFRTSCSRCGGMGTIRGLICGLWRGRGEEKMGKKIKVKIPEGMRDGMEMRIPLKGGKLGMTHMIATIKVSGY